ncbi:MULTISPECIES: hypothetical protein [unclassified Flavobacterium]|uniref:hypothetical protein n=1 Tax=unclassified Flavobacterium TaxID=196869 RepID=UPI0025C3E0C1|nr:MULTISPECIES: hypothetical protein [unclassified Flavobacterium]
MNVKQNNPFRRAYALAFFFGVLGAILKINHIDNSNFFLVIALLCTIAYIALGIYEVNKSIKIDSSEKTLWTIGFITLGFFVGIYYMMNRDRIV